MIGDAELNKKPAPRPKRATPFIRNFLRLLTRHWKGKLVCLLVAIFVWGYLIGQDDALTREKTFQNVQINVSNQDTLLRNGLIVVSGLENLTMDRFTAEVPQKVYHTVSASNYNVRVDLSRVREAGEQELTVLYTSTSTYGTVTALSRTSLPVVVEEYITRYSIPVSLKVVGEAPDERYLGETAYSPKSIIVSGPRSLVSRVARCLVTYDLSLLDGTIGHERTSVPFTLVDVDGNAITSDLIAVTSEQVALSGITVEQTVAYRRDIRLDALGVVTGEPADGYKITSVTFQPEVITVGGSQAAIDAYDTLMFTALVDVTDAIVPIRRVLTVVRPDELMLNESVVVVTVQIEPAS